MIGVIERIKNSVLLKCSTLNDEVISKTLDDLINTRIYRFSEEMVSLIGDFESSITEEILRNEVSKIIKTPIIKKIKRKLFIDSLALQITNDTFIEDYVNEKIDSELNAKIEVSFSLKSIARYIGRKASAATSVLMSTCTPTLCLWLTRHQ